MKTDELVNDIVNDIIVRKENITAYIHNTSIQLRKIKQKPFQMHRFYGGLEEQEDIKSYNLYMSVLYKLSEDRPTLRRMYNIYNPNI